MEQPRQDDLPDREERHGGGDVGRAEGQPASQHEEGQERLGDLVQAERLCVSRQAEPRLAKLDARSPVREAAASASPVAGASLKAGATSVVAAQDAASPRNVFPAPEDGSAVAERPVEIDGPWRSGRRAASAPGSARIRDRQQDERPGESGRVTHGGGSPARAAGFERKRGRESARLSPATESGGVGSGPRVCGIVGETGTSAGVHGGTPSGSSPGGRSGATGTPAGAGTGTSRGSVGRAGAG